MKKLFLFFAAVVLASVLVPVNAAAQSYYGYGSIHRYGGGYYGNYGGYGYQPQSGIKFHMDLVPFEDRQYVKNGVITVDGNEFGIVNRHDGFWNSILVIPPGSHEVSVILPDSRTFTTRVSMMPGQIIPVYVRFMLPQPPPAPSQVQPQPAQSVQPAATATATITETSDPNVVRVGIPKGATGAGTRSSQSGALGIREIIERLK